MTLAGTGIQTTNNTDAFFHIVSTGGNSDFIMGIFDGDGGLNWDIDGTGMPPFTELEFALFFDPDGNGLGIGNGVVYDVWSSDGTFGMAKQVARQAGAHEAIMVAGGYVTEGGSCNIYIVKEGVVITRHLSNEILAGITRACLLSLARDNMIKIDERPFTLEEAYDADEMFTSSASTFICPVVSVDDRLVNSAVIGPVVRRLQEVYVAHARRIAV